MKKKDYKSLLDAASEEHKAWLEAVIDDTLSDNNYVAVNAKRMLGTYLGIIGNKKSTAGPTVEVKVEE